MENKPIKRHKALKTLSHDHHHGLMLCWKIKEGMKKNVELQRIKRYTDWFWENHLVPHFAAEEEYVFPVLGDDNPLIRQAVAEHANLKELFNQTSNLDLVFKRISKDLESHIRFEERVLFNEIQKEASPEQLLEIEKRHNHPDFCDNSDDEFWK